MADIDKLKDMQSDVLKRLQIAVEENLRDLDEAMRTGRTRTVAWLTRNLLELAVWTSHCAESEANSKEFVLDAARDVHDAMDLPDGMFSTTDSFQAERRAAIEKTQQDGFETLDERYRAVSKIAKELGKGLEFQNLNKLLSKFAHPTALSVINNHAAANDTLKHKFHRIGASIGAHTLDLIRASIK
jgi:hypothetical protein